MRLDDRQHVRRVHRQPVLAEGGSQLPRRGERLDRRHSIATRPAQPAPLEQRPHPDPTGPGVTPLHGIQHGVSLVDASLEPQRTCQLRQRLVGPGGVAGLGGGLDRGPEASLGGGRVVEVPEVIQIVRHVAVRSVRHLAR